MITSIRTAIVTGGASGIGKAIATRLARDGIAVAIESDFTPTCEMALAVRPFVLAAGAIIAFLIASGVWMGRGDN